MRLRREALSTPEGRALIGGHVHAAGQSRRCVAARLSEGSFRMGVAARRNRAGPTCPLAVATAEA
jgi:hypothetical protein